MVTVSPKWLLEATGFQCCVVPVCCPGNARGSTSCRAHKIWLRAICKLSSPWTYTIEKEKWYLGNKGEEDNEVLVIKEKDLPTIVTSLWHNDDVKKTPWWHVLASAASGEVLTGVKSGLFCSVSHWMPDSRNQHLDTITKTSHARLCLYPDHTRETDRNQINTSATQAETGKSFIMSKTTLAIIAASVQQQALV